MANNDDDDVPAQAAPPPAPAPAVAAITQRQLLGYAMQLLFVGLAAVVVYGFVSVTRDGELRRRCTPACILRPEYLGANRTAPNFTMMDKTGAQVSLSDFKDKVVVLNFWSTTCEPCLREMEGLVDLTKVLRDRPDVVVLTATTDEDPKVVEQTLAAILPEPPPFTVLFDPESKYIGAKYGTRMVPETWIIDKHGIIRARFDGPRHWNDATIVELIDQFRAGSYCEVTIDRGQGELGQACEKIIGTLQREM